jgi:putative transposase
MTASLGPWPTWATGCPIRRWETSAPPRRCSGSEEKPDHVVERHIAAHRSVLAGADFFTVEVLTWRGLVTYYVLFFLHLESRRVNVAGITRHPDQEWMQKIARGATQESWGYLHPCRYVLHDRDTEFLCVVSVGTGGGRREDIPLPARSPNLNAFAERWVRSAKEECLSKLILFGERPLTRTLAEFSAHYHGERNHQGKANKLLFPEAGDEPLPRGHPVECRQRLGGLLKYYGRAA